MMDTEQELIDMALSIGAAGGAVADAVKKQVFHLHGVDWPLLLTLAEVLRINAATLALLAEQQIERAAQPALDFGDMLPGDVAEQCDACHACGTLRSEPTHDPTCPLFGHTIECECAMCDTAGVGRLSNVTIGPGAS